MTTLVWLQFALTAFASSFFTYRITRWFYRRKINKLNKKYATNNANNT